MSQLNPKLICLFFPALHVVFVKFIQRDLEVLKQYAGAQINFDTVFSCHNFFIPLHPYRPLVDPFIMHIYIL